MEAKLERSSVGARLTIDLGALASNWRELAAMTPHAETGAVIKADAYGTGAVAAMQTLLAAGCRTFFVATVREGIAVRSIDDAATVYILNGLPPGGADLLAAHGLRPVLNSRAEIDEWVAAGITSLPPAIQFDTGMNRLGLSPDETDTLAGDRALVEKIGPALIMSHLACADDPASPKNVDQLSRFRTIGASFPGVPASLANSAGIMLGDAYQFDVTRPGIALYGGRSANNRPALAPVVTAETMVLQIRDADAGGTVGYGAQQTLRRRSRLATLGVGYADGYLRAAGSRDDREGAQVFVRGKAAPLVGRVSMDLMVADVTDIEGVERGDWAELFGPNILLDAVADRAGTIGYELLTDLGRRYARTYVGL